MQPCTVSWKPTKPLSLLTRRLWATAGKQRGQCGTMQQAQR